MPATEHRSRYPQALQLTTLLPGARPIASSTRVPNGGDSSVAQRRLELDTDGNYFLNVMQARDGGGGAITATLVDNASDYRVTLKHPDGRTAVIVFAKGTTTPGGSFGFASSGTPTPNPLIDHVQGFAVTDAGPAWTAP